MFKDARFVSRHNLLYVKCNYLFYRFCCYCLDVTDYIIKLLPFLLLFGQQLYVTKQNIIFTERYFEFSFNINMILTLKSFKTNLNFSTQFV